MNSTKYFAYGSNMLQERLRFREVNVLSEGRLARVDGYKLVFNKKSIDGSSKANLIIEKSSRSWGILFEVDSASLGSLDEAEGAPDDYEQKTIEVIVGDTKQEVMTYLAAPGKVEPVPGKPYNWYLALIVAGAINCKEMPPEWISYLRKHFETKPDNDSQRREKAVKQLTDAGYADWEKLIIP